MEQLMGINGENIFLFLKANCSEIERMNERQKPEKPLALDANGSDEPLMLCRLEIPEQALDFQPATSSPPLSGCIHRKAINRNKGCSKNQVELIFDFLEMNFCQLRKEYSGLCDWRNLQKGALRSQPKRKHFLLNISYPVIHRTPHKPFPGRNRILSANSSSVKPQRLSRSRWRIHRATIERFISVYRLEENGSLLKEGTGDAVSWALRACSYKTKTEASQQRRSRHTLQGVFLVCICPFLSLCLFDSSSLCLFVSLSLCLFVSLINETINGH